MRGSARRAAGGLAMAGLLLAGCSTVDARSAADDRECQRFAEAMDLSHIKLYEYTNGDKSAAAGSAFLAALDDLRATSQSLTFEDAGLAETASVLKQASTAAAAGEKREVTIEELQMESFMVQGCERAGSAMAIRDSATGQPK